MTDKITTLEDATEEAWRELARIKEKLELAATGPNAVLAAAAMGLLRETRAMLQRLTDRCPCLLGMDLGHCCTCLDCAATMEYGDPFEGD